MASVAGGPATPVTDVARTIGGLVAELIPRDATLQFGIGAIPAAVLEHLRGASLGEFQLVGMVSDPMVDLLRERVPTLLGDG